MKNILGYVFVFVTGLWLGSEMFGPSQARLGLAKYDLNFGPTDLNQCASKISKKSELKNNENSKFLQKNKLTRFELIEAMVQHLRNHSSNETHTLSLPANIWVQISELKKEDILQISKMEGVDKLELFRQLRYGSNVSAENFEKLSEVFPDLYENQPEWSSELRHFLAAWYKEDPFAAKEFAKTPVHKDLISVFQESLDAMEARENPENLLSKLDSSEISSQSSRGLAAVSQLAIELYSQEGVEALKLFSNTQNPVLRLQLIRQFTREAKHKGSVDELLGLYRKNPDKFSIEEAQSIYEAAFETRLDKNREAALSWARSLELESPLSAHMQEVFGRKLALEANQDYVQAFFKQQGSGDPDFDRAFVSAYALSNADHYAWLKDNYSDQPEVQRLPAWGENQFVSSK